MYNEIYNFCRVRDKGKQGFSNRADFIVKLLNKYNIEHKIVKTKSFLHGKTFYNIYAFGSSSKFLSGHYDVVNINSDNANDNSASIINMIAYKKMNPSINLLILDGEEPPYMGAGSKYASKYLLKNNIPVKWILNLELTGKGSTFFTDKVKTGLNKCIGTNFPDSFKISTPFNDSMIFRKYGFESNVITLVDVDEEGKIDMSPLYYSHSMQDSVGRISIQDMKAFTENVVDKIVKSC